MCGKSRKHGFERECQRATSGSTPTIVELAIALEISVSVLRHKLKELGDRVECDGKDRWRVARNIVPQNILSETEKVERDDLAVVGFGEQ